MSANYKSNVKKVKAKLTAEENEALTKIAKILSKKVKAKARKSTGILRKAIGYSKRRKEKSLQIGIKKKGFYGGFFELPTKNMPKDPFILPVVEESKDEIQQIIKDFLKKVGK